MGGRDRQKDQSFAKLPGFTAASSGAAGFQDWPELVPIAPVPQGAEEEKSWPYKQSHREQISRSHKMPATVE